MASKLIRTEFHEAENQLELSLRHAFEVLEPKLRPPFPLSVPTTEEYLQLNRAILYGVLCEPHFATTHIKHLHAIVSDGYDSFLSLLINVVTGVYAKLLDSAKNQLLWVTREMIYVSAMKFDGLLVSLLRQIVGGDFSDENLLLCFELVNLLLAKWDTLLEEEPFVLTSALYTFLRLLADHCRLMNNAKLEALRQLEIEFCVKMLREQFHLCLKIGRDLIRLLQDLVHVPEFKAIWKDLALNPGEFTTLGFSDISQVYGSRTSSRYFLLRITPEMETQLRFLLTHVKFGSQKRYQEWFFRKFLVGSERETLLIDIVRFICCAHHPSNEILQSDIIPRWAVIGWLLKLCSKNYIEANVKLALFYDWLFFDERVDNIMNIEPALLLMVCSIPNYIDMTHSLLEFLLLLVDNYDVDHNEIIVKGVSSAFSILVRKGVVPSLEILTSCNALSPFLRERLEKFLSYSKMRILKDSQPTHCPKLPSHSVPPLSLQDGSCQGTSIPSLARHNSKHSMETANVLASDFSLASCSSAVTGENHVDAIKKFVQSLGETIKQSKKLGFQTLEAIMLAFADVDKVRPGTGLICPKVLSSKIKEDYEMTGYKLFAPLAICTDCPESDDEVDSPTALLIRTFIFNPQERMQEMLLFWARDGFPVGARLLSYVARLAYEAKRAGYIENEMVDCNFAKASNLCMPLLIFHVDGYFSFQSARKEGLAGAITSTSDFDKISVDKLVECAFLAYKHFLTNSATLLHRESSYSLSKLLFADIMLCCEWVKKRIKFLFFSIFSYLPDLSIGEEGIIKLLVHQLGHADLLEIQFDICSKKLSVFGENTDVFLNLIKRSLNWDCLQQHKLWMIIRSEVAISDVEVEKIILEFFYCGEVDENLTAIAVGGLLMLCNCRAPTPELVGAIILLPNNNISQDFALAALSLWVVSGASMLFDSFEKFLEKLENDNQDLIFSGSSGIMINHSAMLWLLNYFNSKGMDVSDALSRFSVNIPGKQSSQPS